MLLGTWTAAQGFPRKADSAMRFVRAVAILVWSMWHELFYVIRADASGVHADTLWKTSSLNIDAFRQSDKSLFSFSASGYLNADCNSTQNSLEGNKTLMLQNEIQNIVHRNDRITFSSWSSLILRQLSVLFSCCAVEFSWKLSSWLKSSSVLPQVLPCLMWTLWKFYLVF